MRQSSTYRAADAIETVFISSSSSVPTAVPAVYAAGCVDPPVVLIRLAIGQPTVHTVGE
jgi:hypothetical protein